jgi:hypothetical protein
VFKVDGADFFGECGLGSDKGDEEFKFYENSMKIEYLNQIKQQKPFSARLGSN